MMDFKKRFSLVERQKITDNSSKCLWSQPGKPGRDYLMRERGIAEETLRLFKIGYMPDYMDHQLKGRIIFPLYDPSGNLIAISSRAIKSGGFLPVYWHEQYEKKFYLYGISNACQSMQKWDFCILVEGQFDVLQIRSNGVNNVVGLMGNKLSNVQVAMVQRYCDDIILCLDVDENRAGQKGAMQALDGSVFVHNKWSTNKFPQPYEVKECDYSSSRRIVSVILPENSDPDEFIKKNGIESFKRIIREKLDELRYNDTVS